MNLQLEGKRVLVTGSSSGIGAGIAAVFGAEGAIAVVHGRDDGRAQAVAEEIRAGGGRSIVAIGDLSNDAGASAVKRLVDRELGGIDVLVNNAGGKTTAGVPDWLDIGLDDWAATYQQNVGAAVRMARAFVPGMRERGWGRVVQIASASATQTEAGLGEYQAAKAALVNLSASLARSLARTGVTVNTVSPGLILTPASRAWMEHVASAQGWGGDFAATERRFTAEQLALSVSRIGRPEDIGRMCAFLASPANDFITGANFRVDGGQCRSIN